MMFIKYLAEIYNSDPGLIREGILEYNLKHAFSDTLGKSASRSAILIQFFEKISGERKQPRCMIGVPYEITGGNLAIGPYFRDIISSPPEDYEQRKKEIPLGDIINWRKISFPED